MKIAFFVCCAFMFPIACIAIYDLSVWTFSREDQLPPQIPQQELVLPPGAITPTAHLTLAIQEHVTIAPERQVSNITLPTNTKKDRNNQHQSQAMPAQLSTRAAMSTHATSSPSGHTTPQMRRYPPVGCNDTIRFFQNGKIESNHGQADLFSEADIIATAPIMRSTIIGRGILSTKVHYTKNGKAIIHQQATRGCTAAVAAMLIVDHGRQPDLKALFSRNLGTNADIEADIRNAGLTPVTSKVQTLEDLRDSLDRQGSAIVTVDGKLGGHVMVVDAISRNLQEVRLRDPYHGWEITVTRAAFQKEWKNGGAIIQVKSE